MGSTQSPEPATAPRSSRRHVLRTSLLGGLAAGLARFGAAAAAGGPATRLGPGRATSVILIFNGGAPSHIDLWDPKPNADASVRGMFSPIQTNVPGTHVSELLPRMAQRMDKVALVRSVHHGHSSHNGGMHWATVGRPYRVDSTLINPSPVDLPCVGTLCGWLAQRDGFTAGVPPYVITPFPTCDSKVYITPGQYGGCLGARFDPFVLDDDPNRADFRVRNLALDPGVTPERLAERLGLLEALDGPSGSPRIVASQVTEMDVFADKAVAILQSGRAAEAFDLSREPDAVRERYGRHSWGQSHLLARRLVEAGTRFVTTVNGPSITWDTALGYDVRGVSFTSAEGRTIPLSDGEPIAALF
jgi:hypothetical protein